MATVNKDFRIKHGLIVEGNTATVGGEDILLDGASSDSLTEGTTNLFYTDDRVKDVLTNSAQTNISITEVDGVLTIAAENGVDDSTTDDLNEGTNNLYFTDTRVYDKAKLISTQGNGITVTADDELETITIAVDTDTIATKEYVDILAEGLHVHAAVAVATTENITLSPAPSIIDTVTLTEGMRVLVKNQNTASQNGIYVLNGDGDLVRAADYNTANEIQGGDFVFVIGGDTYAATGWVQINPVTTLGTDPLVWNQFSGAGEYTGGTGIEISGNSISIDFTEIDTDDLDEGSANLYYTDQRVKDVLTGASKTNISITEVDGVLTIEAENGVDDATTDDLDEGETNFYFTNQRAVDALEAVVPNFTAVEVNAVSKQIAGTVNVDSLDVPEAVLSWSKNEYRSAKVLVKLSYGSHTEISELLLTLDSSDNIAITEYAEVATNGSLADITADISGSNVRIMVDVNNNNTVATAFATLIA